MINVSRNEQDYNTFKDLGLINVLQLSEKKPVVFKVLAYYFVFKVLAYYFVFKVLEY